MDAPGGAVFGRTISPPPEVDGLYAEEGRLLHFVSVLWVEEDGSIVQKHI